MNDYFKEQFAKTKEILKDGYTIKQIAKSLQMSKNTVLRYFQMDIVIKLSYPKIVINIKFTIPMEFLSRP